jgi:hypothetical protein
MKQKALVIDQGFFYARILSLISLKWSKVIVQEGIFPNRSTLDARKPVACPYQKPRQPSEVHAPKKFIDSLRILGKRPQASFGSSIKFLPYGL